VIAGLVAEVKHMHEKRINPRHPEFVGDKASNSNLGSA
jgi:hypothetical protein